MSEITHSEEQKTAQDPKKEILEELFGAVHEYADGKSLSIRHYDYSLTQHWQEFTFLSPY